MKLIVLILAFLFSFASGHEGKDRTACHDTVVTGTADENSSGIKDANADFSSFLTCRNSSLADGNGIQSYAGQSVNPWQKTRTQAKNTVCFIKKRKLMDANLHHLFPVRSLSPLFGNGVSASYIYSIRFLRL